MQECIQGFKSLSLRHEISTPCGCFFCGAGKGPAENLNYQGFTRSACYLAKPRSVKGESLEENEGGVATLLCRETTKYFSAPRNKDRHFCLSLFHYFYERDLRGEPRTRVSALPYDFWRTIRLKAKAAIDNCRAGRAAKGANPFLCATKKGLAESLPFSGF